MATSTPSKRNAVVIADTVTVSGNVSATDLTLSGNLTVSGTTTTLNTATLQVEDKNIVLNYGTGDTSGSANGAGITIQDAVNSSTNATMNWNTSSDRFDFSHHITVPSGNSANWNTAYGWGNHATQGYLTDASSFVDLTSAQTITGTKTISNLVGGTLEFDKLVYDWTSGTKVPIVELKNATSYGWFYHEGSPDQMMFSTSGNTNYELAFSSSYITHKGNAIWHAGNDGSGSGLDADTVDGLHIHTGRNNQANKVVRTDSNGYIQAGWINTTSGNHGTTTMDRIYASNDGYIRYYTPANFGSQISSHINYNNIQNKPTIPTSLPANGGNADTVDSLHAASFLRSDANDTATGNLTFTGNISQTNGTFLSHGAQVSNLTTAWQAAGTSKDRGLYPFRFQDGATGQPESGNNAHWGLNIYAHAGSSGNYPYGTQLSAGSTQTLWHRWWSNGGAQSWRKIWDSANDGSGSGLDADLLDGQHGSHYLNYNNLTNKPTIPTSLPANGGNADTVDGFHVDSDNGGLVKSYQNQGSGTFHSTISEKRSSMGMGYLSDGPNSGSDWYRFIQPSYKDGSGTSNVWQTQLAFYGTGGDFYLRQREGGSFGSSGWGSWNRVWTSATDGSGSGLDADLLDGQHGSYYLNASNINAGTLPEARLPTQSKYVRSDVADTATQINSPIFSGNISTSGDGQNNYPFRLTSDYNSYMIAAAGNTWGLFWAGNSGAKYGTNGAGGPGNIWSNSSNPNEFVFAGNNSTKWTLYGNTGDSWQAGTARTSPQGILWGASNDGAGSGLDADTLDGIDSARIVFGSGARKTTNADPNSNTAMNSGFYDINSTNAPTSTWYSYITMAHTNTANEHGHQIAGSFYSDGALYNRHYDGTNASFGNWTQIWNAANDGSGSGLDADLLDGQQGSYYAPASSIPSVGNGTITISAGGGLSGGGSFTVNQSGGTTITLASTVSKGTNQNYVASSTSTSNRGNYGAGVWTYSGYSTGSDRPFTYDATLQVMPDANRGFELSVDWLSTSSTPLKIRSLRDCCQGWSDYSTIWTSSTDGASSGLDADLLDGQHGSHYLNYNNLSNKPTIPSNTNQLTNGAGFLTNTSGEHITYVYRIHSSDSTSPDNFGYNNRYQTFNYGVSSGVTGPLISFGGLGSNYPMQITGNYGGGGSLFKVRTRNGDNGTWNSWRTLWHNGNDGSGSGLDADLLDGQHGSYYAPASSIPTSLPANGGNADTVDGLHASSFLRSDTADTGSGKITLTATEGLEVGGVRGRAIGDQTGDFIQMYERVSIGYPSGWGATAAGAPAYGLSTWGGVQFNKGNVSNAPFTFNGNTVWHAGNDGPGSGLDADTVDGLQVHTARNNEANKIVRTNVHGYLDTGYINTINNDMTTTLATKVYVSNDNYIRHHDMNSFRSLMNVSANGNYNGREQSTSDTNYWIGSMGWGTTDLNNVLHYGSGFWDSWGTPGNRPSTYTTHWTGINMMHYSASNTYHHGGQMAMGAGNPAHTYLRGWWANGGSGYGWQKIWTDGNDGASSGLDADTLDGQHGSFYQNAGNLNAGTIPEARLPTQAKYIRSDANDSFTGQLTMSTQKALIASNYGHGVYGVYSATRYQHVWSMGTGYNLPANGSDNSGAAGNLYGLAWTYNPDHGGAGNNPQAKAGLNHQLLLMMNGTTYTALGNGIWTSGAISRNGNTVWDSGNDGPNSGLDADTVDGLHESSFMRKSANSHLDMNGYNINDLDRVETQAENKDVKYSVWSGTTYGVGMTAGVTLGHLNDYAMTFCMNNDSDRGFWWGYEGQTKSAGAMSLTTSGRLWVTSDISTPNTELDSYTSGNISVGRLTLKGGGKTGWGSGHEHGSIDFYNSDGSGVGARNAVRIVAENNQGNGSSTTTFEGELAIYTSAYNSQLNSDPAIRLQSNNSARFYGNLRAPNGTLGAPAYTFAGDQDSGMTSIASNAVGFITGGTQRFKINSNGLLLTGTSHLYINGQRTITNARSIENIVNITNTDGYIEMQRTGSAPAIFDRLGTTGSSGTSNGEILNFKTAGTRRANIGFNVPYGSRFHIGFDSGSFGLQFYNFSSSMYIAPSQDDGANKDNLVDLGSSGSRWDDVYATNGTIQTSDRNEKQDIQALTDAETRVATACKGLIRRFRWIDSVQTKGDDARYHFGAIAQDVEDAFTAEGLNAGDYALFIKNHWWEHEGTSYPTAEAAPSGAVEKVRRGIRYNQLLAFIISAL